MAGTKYEVGPRASTEAQGVKVTIKICNKAAKAVTGLEWDEGNKIWDRSTEMSFHLSDSKPDEPELLFTTKRQNDVNPKHDLSLEDIMCSELTLATG